MDSDNCAIQLALMIMHERSIVNDFLAHSWFQSTKKRHQCLFVAIVNEFKEL